MSARVVGPVDSGGFGGPDRLKRVGLSDADSTEGEIRVSGPGKLSDLVSEGGGARSSSSEGGVVDSPGGGR